MSCVWTAGRSHARPSRPAGRASEPFADRVDGGRRRLAEPVAAGSGGPSGTSQLCCVAARSPRHRRGVPNLMLTRWTRVRIAVCGVVLASLLLAVGKRAYTLQVRDA